MFSYLSIAHSQNDCVENENMNILYFGINNPISFSGSKVHCDSLIVFSDNATIVGTPCRFHINPSSLGSVHVNFALIDNMDTIIVSTRSFRVKDVPIPRLTLGGTLSGKINLNHVKAQRGLGVYCEVSLQKTYNILSYMIIGIREHKIFFQSNRKGNIFGEEIAQLFDGLGYGDKLIFCNIRAIDENGNIVDVQSAEFEIYN